ncbi:MAG: rhodanese-like domain-containing protein [Anaerolineae bacterium]|nr:rhodanese-like domain-containing protein [Anaerolineae bacterium]
MKIMSQEALKAKLDRGDHFKLYMTLDQHAFDTSHIPGSVHLENVDEVIANLSPDEEVVVYCANPACPSSTLAYRMLRKRGHRNLYRYAGGLEAWYEAGYELVGEGAALETEAVPE